MENKTDDNEEVNAMKLYKDLLNEHGGKREKKRW
jgi:hypothetical protein